MKFQDIPKFIHGGNYQVDVQWTYLESWLDSYSDHGSKGVDLDPDFQRAHVWDEYKQAAYVEYILRGGQSSYSLHWNSPRGPSSGEVLTIVDGKQRMEAVRKFMRNDLRIFLRPHHLLGRSKKGYRFEDFEDKLGFDSRFRMHVNNLEARADVLTWYLQLNEGGVVHTEEELHKVRVLLEEEQGQ
jgi:hypothetical protein